MSDEKLEVADVLNDLDYLRRKLVNNRDEELVQVLTSFSDSLTFGVEIDTMLKRFFATGKLNVEDRAFVEKCHLLLFSEYGMEE